MKNSLFISNHWYQPTCHLLTFMVVSISYCWETNPPQTLFVQLRILWVGCLRGTFAWVYVSCSSSLSFLIFLPELGGQLGSPSSGHMVSPSCRTALTCSHGGGRVPRGRVWVPDPQSLKFRTGTSSLPQQSTGQHKAPGQLQHFSPLDGRSCKVSLKVEWTQQKKKYGQFSVLI